MILGPQLDMTRAPTKAGELRPRPYQATTDAAIDRELEAHRSTLAVLPTGTGKTVVFSLQIVKRGGGLILAHRDSLITQAAEKLEWALAATHGGTTFPRVAIEKAERTAFASPYIVASVQTLKGRRLERFARNFDVRFIVIDEAHRAVAPSYRNILAAFPNAKVLGVTATPDRTDEVALRHVFETVAYEYSLLDATADGWLAPLRFVPIHSEVNLDAVKVTGSGVDRDFDQAQLDDAVVKEAGRIAESLSRAVGPTDRLIVFTPGVKTAHAGAEAMNLLLPESSGVVDGTMADDDKRPILEAHRAGKLRFLWNVGVLTEGYDDPSLTGIFDAAPTKSRLRAMQRWGRATRPGISVDAHETPEARRAAIAASFKPWAVVYDLVANSSHHDVTISAVDILAGKELPEAVRKRAKEILDAEGGTVGDAVAEAEKREAEAKRRAMAAKRIALAVKVMVGTPRSLFERAVDSLPPWKRKLPRRPEDYPSKGMLWKMMQRGIPIPEKLSFAMARKLINLDIKREREGRVRLAGVEWLRKYGIDAWKLKRDEGVALRDAIVAAGKMPLTEQEVGRILLEVRDARRSDGRDAV